MDGRRRGLRAILPGFADRQRQRGRIGGLSGMADTRQIVR
jgi:hypothetical protein